MTLASTSRTQVRYIKETTFGETPTIGTAKDLRITGESLTFALTKETSQELNAYRASTSMVATQAEASGSVNFELSYAEYDPLLEGVLQSTYTAYGTNGAGTAFDATFTATTITATTAPTTTSAFTNLKAGQWFTVRGSGTANDNRLFRVHKTTTPTSTVITLDAGTPAAVGTGALTKIHAARLSNGTTQPSFSIERYVSDVSEYFVYRGMTPSSMSLEVSAGALTTGEFAFMGTDASQANTSFMPAGTPTASKSYDIMSGVSGTSCALWAKGVPLTGTFVTSLSMSYDNALRAQNAICKLGAVGIGSGTIEATFSIEAFFASGAMFFTEFRQNESIELAFTSFDTAGNGYVFTLPKANISSYEVSANGKDEDLMVSLEVTALLDLGNLTPELRKVMFIDRLGDAVAP